MNRTIEASTRSARGKNESRRLRAAGRIPANLLDRGNSTPIEIDEREFEKLIASGLRSSSKFKLKLNGAEQEVLAKEIHRHPVSGRILHVDFYKVNPGHKFRVSIPVELSGSAKGVKAGGALEHYIRQLKVVTVPEKIIEKIEVDITDLGVGEAVHLSQLNLPPEWETRLTGDPVVCRVAQSRITLKAASEGKGG